MGPARTAIVTGASSGLGVTLAEALAGAGANVVVAARRAGRLEQLAGSIEDEGGRALAVPCDVADPEQVAAMIQSALECFGTIDILVNNAGTAGDAGPMAEKLPHALFEAPSASTCWGSGTAAGTPARSCSTRARERS
jgi:NAD(P)-dependent dehydrogenase (short-subunit alcohol dehydrogenase family)